MASISRQLMDLKQDCVMEFPMVLKTAVQIRENQTNLRPKGGVPAFPLPYDYLPTSKDIKRLVGTQMAHFGGKYLLIDDAPAEKYETFIWNMCRSYVALGYLPPAVISNLQGNRAEVHDNDVLTIGACRRSLKIARDLYGNALAAFRKRFGV
jgi:hypothetical protein